MHASAGWYGDHTVDATSDGVTVRKGLDLDTLALPALKFEIRSERDDPVGVRVVDRLPTAVDPNRVGVHADFAADQWTAFEDGRVAFTTRLDPDRPVVTLYGIWMDDPSRVHELLGSPDVKVTSDPDAPSLDPIGEPVSLPTVDDSLRSVGPDALADLRADVEAALTGARAEPTESPTALPGSTTDGPDAGSEDAEGTMGDHAWTYPVERRGTGRIAAPTHADLDDLLEDETGRTDETDADGERGRAACEVGEDHVYLRAALADTHHGGGGALLLQELANAFHVVARRVTGDAERATVDAVVETPLGGDAVLRALADREQVTDALVSPLVGDRDDATGIDAKPEEATATADREDTEELSIEPNDEGVEVVLNADGKRFTELKAEFEVETDTDALEDELARLELPGVDTSEEPSIDELVDGDDAFDATSDDAEFVPASVDDEEALSFEDDPADATELNFAADAADATDATHAADATEGNDATHAADATHATDGNDATHATDGNDATDATHATDAADATDGDDDGFDLGAFAAADEDTDLAVADDDTDLMPFEFDAPSRAPASEASRSAATDDADGDVEQDELPTTADVADDGLGEPTAADPAGDADVVEVPAGELAAMRSEMRELRDRVATLESELAAVRADLARERGVDSRPTVGDGGESVEAVDGADDGD